MLCTTSMVRNKGAPCKWFAVSALDNGNGWEKKEATEQMIQGERKARGKLKEKSQLRGI